jgi:hypothetical protein
VAVKPIEAFAVGRWADSNKVVRDYPDYVVQEIADSYDPARHRAPIVVNHDETQPNQGLVERLYKEGGKLFAIPSGVGESFKQLVNNGSWPAVSSGFYAPEDPNNPNPGKWGLRHLSFVNVPAVKGLAHPAFGEADTEFIEIYYSEASNAETPVETADPITEAAPDETPAVAESIKPNTTNKSDVPKTSPTEAVAKDVEPTTPVVDRSNETAAQEQLLKLEKDALEAAKVEFAESQRVANEALEQQKSDLERQRLELANQKVRAERRAKDLEFCDALTKNGQLTPGHYDRVLALLQGPQEVDGICFSDPSGTSLDREELLRSVLADLLPKDINFSEISQSTGDDATASTGSLNQFEIKAQAEALVATKLAAGTKITFLQAVDEVTGGTN